MLLPPLLQPPWYLMSEFAVGVGHIRHGEVVHILVGVVGILAEEDRIRVVEAGRILVEAGHSLVGVGGTLDLDGMGVVFPRTEKK